MAPCLSFPFCKAGVMRAPASLSCEHQVPECMPAGLCGLGDGQS